MRHTAILTAAGLLATTLTLPAQAGRPLQAEDAGVLDARACEVEGASQRLRETGAPSATQTGLQLSCGIGYSSQLALAASRSSAGGDKVQGLRLGGKTALWRGAGEAPAAATLAWGLRAERASGGDWEHAATELNGVVSVPMNDLTAHMNLGHVRDEAGGGSATTWALALEHAGLGSLAPMGEFFGDDHGAPWWNLGLRWTVVPERAVVDASYGRQIRSGRPTLWSVGFKFSF